MTIFCRFRTLNNHKKHYKPIWLAQEVSADPQGPRTTKNEIYFLRGSEPLCKGEAFRQKFHLDRKMLACSHRFFKILVFA